MSLSLYEMKHDGTDEEVRRTLRAWEAGDVVVNMTYKFTPYNICATAEATNTLPRDRKIFMSVKFSKATIISIKKDGRLECIGKPIKDPDPKYDNSRIQREFRFYLLISPGTKLVPDINQSKERPHYLQVV